MWYAFKNPAGTLQQCSLKAGAIVAMVAVLASGCASTHGLSPQGRMFTPATVAAAKSLANDGDKYAKTWPAIDWWRALGDPQLDQLIESALKDSPDLAAADARVRQSSALAMNADAQRSAKLTAQASVQGIRIPGKVLSSTSQDEYFTPKILGLNGSYSFDLWGGERAAWEAALGRQHAIEVDAQAARLMLSVNVARTYARLAYVYQALTLTQKNAERAQHILDLTRQRVDAGIDGIVQQRQAENAAASSRQQLAQAQHEVEVEQNALSVLIGKGPDDAAKMTPPALLKPLALTLPDDLPADLLGRRPDIVAARWRVEASRQDIDAAHANFYPSFNLTAAVGLVSSHTDDLISLRSRYYAVAPAISLPLFDGGRLRANLAGRNAEYDLAVAQYNNTLVIALNDVALQLQATHSLTTQEIAQQHSVDAAREAWELAMQRYRRGIGSYIEALTVEQSVLTAEATLDNIHTRQIDTAIQLVRALGGGYSIDTIESQSLQQDSRSPALSPISKTQTDKASS